MWREMKGNPTYICSILKLSLPMANKVSPTFKKVGSVVTPIRTYGKRKPTVQIISSSPSNSRDNESDSQSQSQGAHSQDDYKISFSSQDSLLDELYEKSTFATKFADGGFSAELEDEAWDFDSPPRSRDSITNSGGSDKSAPRKYELYLYFRFLVNF